MDKKNTLHDELKASVMADPEGKSEYEAFKLQLELSNRMKKLRKEAHLTQDDLAKTLQTSKSTIARLETGGGRDKHSPSLKTLFKYASALGCRLDIKLTPLKESSLRKV